ncbi:heparinase II/III family protein [Halomonas colorata]|uniref:Heparinase II/III family protein n=1 Tax=Halomonas colorata TaxID=2742615 RepID=A0ABR9G0I6_9GAMM|nr:heparinase II/III family protein [Halomonas colorata]MBE0464403.1 heparinase II/III family protein [Halomonas colorata]
MTEFRKVEPTSLNLYSAYFSLKISRDAYQKNLSLLSNGVLFGHSKNKIHNINIRRYEDWFSLDKEKPSVQWHYHTIGRGCGVALARYSEYTAVKDIIFSIISCWAKANYESNFFENSEQAWAGHTVALRLDFLIAAFLILDDNQRIKIADLISHHINYLLEDDNYDGNWNHGLDQSISLLKAAFVFNNKKAYKISVKRILENFQHSFDDEGVNNEQAVMYHNYNIERFSYAQRLLRFFDSDVSSFDSILNKARLFMLHALDPKGNYALLGDTILTNPVFEHGSQKIDYVTSRSQQGIFPEDKCKAVYTAGYVFGRSSWEARDVPSYYTLRFGPARIIHGHNDHTGITYFSQDEMVITDGGFDGYGADEYRAFFRSPQAHNVVFCPGEKKFLWDAHTQLVFSEQAEGFDVYTLYDKPYVGIKRVRVAMFDLVNDIFYVYDKICSDEEKEFCQNWCFSPSSLVNFNDRSVSINTSGKKFRLHLDVDYKVELFKGSQVYTSGKSVVVGGFTGSGHNHKEESYTLRSFKYGSSVSWRSFFSQDKFNTKRLDDNSFILEERIIYRVSDEGGRCSVEKQSLDKDVSYLAAFSNISYTDEYSQEGSGYVIYNRDKMRKNFFAINFNNVLCEIGGNCFFDIKVSPVDGDAPTYYYLSAVDGKRRFGLGMVVKDIEEMFSAKIPISPSSKVKVEFIIKSVSVVNCVEFPLEELCQ